LRYVLHLEAAVSGVGGPTIHADRFTLTYAGTRFYFLHVSDVVCISIELGTLELGGGVPLDIAPLAPVLLNEGEPPYTDTRFNDLVYAETVPGCGDTGRA